MTEEFIMPDRSPNRNDNRRIIATVDRFSWLAHTQKATIRRIKEKNKVDNDEENIK